ncbi:hypothetical protein FHETE_5568 [Fusarium heterosporum]|uniref:Peptidase S8/S53 domain-containing protein n=1 Tax=Fusarium heterosporum TaxID=42747 RepID=A0A8H5TEU8_FUSHE|nr:hypothetical protein FHETE_5568 [Fusarium heterosporum]
MARRPPPQFMKTTVGSIGNDVTQAPDVLAIRSRLLTQIEQNLDKNLTIEQLIKDHEETLQKCAEKKDDDDVTILHWIVGQVKGLVFPPDGDMILLKPYEILIQLSMKYDEQLVAVTDKAKETALHRALKSRDKAMVLTLASYMSNYGGATDAFKKALSIANTNGENPLHLAVANDKFLAAELIPIAEKKAFLQKRNLTLDGSPVTRGGNTPLHDAVHFGTAVFEIPDCNFHENQCRGCGELSERFDESVSLAIELVQKLTHHGSEALKAKNGNDESPYLYHLRTKGEYLKLDPKAEGNAKSELDINIRLTPAKVQDSATEGKIGHGVPTTKCGIVKGYEATDTIEELLREWAFAIGSFEDACSCFFGENPDEDGRSSPFRPGYPVLQSSPEVYQNLIPEGTRVLSHVDLCVSSYVKDSTLEVHHPNASETESDIDQWNRNMRNLKKMFRMIRKRQVKQILKVTIYDNPKRPCSDETIQACLEGFDVRYLDWNKPDLSIDVIHAACPRLAEIKLYSSGRKSVFSGWTSNTGLCNLHQLKCLDIKAVRGLETHDHYTESVQQFTNELEQKMRYMREKLRLTCERQEKMIQVENIERSIRSGNEWLREQREADSSQKSQIQEAEEWIVSSESQLHIHRDGLRLLGPRLRSLDHEIEKLEMRSHGISSTLFEEIRVISIQDLCQRDIGIVEAECYSSRTKGYGTIHDVSHGVISSSALGENSAEYQQGQSFDRADGPWPGLFQIKRKDGGRISVVRDFKIRKQDLEDPPTEPGNAAKPQNLPGNSAESLSAIVTPNRWINAIEAFVRKAGFSNLKNSTPVKVALIDDGVNLGNLIGQTENFQIPGWPILKSYSNDRPWCHSEGNHGTEMAKLILKMCPNAKLLVAKLGGKDMNARLDNATDAAEAVKWAIKNKVDVISMSWSLIKSNNNKEGVKQLEDQIQLAAKANIIMYCAAPDQKYYKGNGEIVPHSTDTKRIRIVGAAKENGTKSNDVATDQVDYLFPGEGIKDLGEKGGSSAATALAAGFAALILSCYKGFHDKGISSVANPDHMHYVMESLQPNGKKWVNATKLVGMDNAPRCPKYVVSYCESVITTNGGN